MKKTLYEYPLLTCKDSAMSSEISPGQKVRLETWWANSAGAAPPEVGCYFWCRESDQFLPKPPPDSDSTHKELESVVSVEIWINHQFSDFL